MTVRILGNVYFFSYVRPYSQQKLLCTPTLLLGTPHSRRGNVLRKLHLSPTVLLGPKFTHTAHNRNENGFCLLPPKYLKLFRARVRDDRGNSYVTTVRMRS
jgi:hypothetical protein